MNEPNPKLYGIVLDLVTTVQTGMSLRNIDNSRIDNVIKQTLLSLFLREDTNIVLENVRSILIKLKSVSFNSLSSLPLVNFRPIAHDEEHCENMIDAMIEKRGIVKSVIIELFNYLQSVSVANAQDALEDTGREIDDLFLTTLLLKDRKSPDKVAAQYDWHSVDELTVMYFMSGDLMNHFLTPTSTYIVRKRWYRYSQKKTIYTFVCDVDMINVLVRKNYMDKLESIVLEYNTKI